MPQTHATIFSPVTTADDNSAIVFNSCCGYMITWNPSFIHTNPKRSFTSYYPCEFSHVWNLEINNSLMGMSKNVIACMSIHLII